MGGGALLADHEWSTGALVVSDALPDALLTDLERDVNLIIDAFDGGYEPPARPGSLTSGAREKKTKKCITLFYFYIYAMARRSPCLLSVRAYWGTTLPFYALEETANTAPLRTRYNNDHLSHTHPTTDGPTFSSC